MSLLPATEKREDDLMHAPEEWTALAPIKERPSFKFGPLDHPSMDLMLLQVKANFRLKFSLVRMCSKLQLKPFASDYTMAGKCCCIFQYDCTLQ